MRPSLTPHLDAVQRVSTRAKNFANPMDAAAHRAFMAAITEAATLMDQGREPTDILAFAEAVTASIIDSIATTTASGHANKKRVRTELICTVLRGVGSRLAGPSDYTDHETVSAAAPGRA